MRARVAAMLADLLDADRPGCHRSALMLGMEQLEAFRRVRLLLGPLDDARLVSSLDAVRASGVLSCPAPECERRRTAFEGASFPTSDARSAELRVISALAERSSTYLASGAIFQASVTQDLQSEFLKHHAHRCLDSLGLELTRQPDEVLRAIGAVLLERIQEDVLLLVSAR